VCGLSGGETKVAQPLVQGEDHGGQLLDPYAQVLTGGAGGGIPPRGRRGPRHGLIVHDTSDWGDEPPLIRPVDAIIYELHVRGFGGDGVPASGRNARSRHAHTRPADAGFRGQPSRWQRCEPR
jgi:hypothetical protein